HLARNERELRRARRGLRPRPAATSRLRDRVLELGERRRPARAHLLRDELADVRGVARAMHRGEVIDDGAQRLAALVRWAALALLRREVLSVSEAADDVHERVLERERIVRAIVRLAGERSEEQGLEVGREPLHAL